MNQKKPATSSEKLRSMRTMLLGVMSIVGFVSLIYLSYLGYRAMNGTWDEMTTLAVVPLLCMGCFLMSCMVQLGTIRQSIAQQDSTPTEVETQDSRQP